MDLSLQGSQINLVTRYRPKTPLVTYPNLQRPRSASFFIRKKPTSALFKRPQSADGKFERSHTESFRRFNDNNFNDGKLIKNKKYLSASSSNLLKFLLDEPIKRRPWLLRDSDDNRSLAQKKSNTKYSESLDLSSVEGDKCCDPSLNNQKNVSFKRPQSASRLKTAVSKISNSYLSIPGTTPTTDLGMSQRCSSNYSLASDLWCDSKPDLAGRVSFGKSDVYEIDLSDCDNDKQMNYQSSSDPLKQESNTIGNIKKTVSFGNTSKIHAETFEYPKSPSDNCSCSTRSCSTVGDGEEPNANQSCLQCSCNYECNTLHYTKSPKDTSIHLKSEIHHSGTKPSNFNENPVIMEYKKTVQENTVSIPQPVNILGDSAIQDYKNTLNDGPHKFNLEHKLSERHSSNGYLNNAPTKQISDLSTSIKDFGKQNDFTDMINNKNAVVEMYQETKRKMILPSENIKLSLTDNPNESNLVINNYLKVSSNPIVTKGTNHNVILKSTVTNKVTKGRRSKSVSTGCRKSTNDKMQTPHANQNLYASFRQDSNLNEFQLDKVESWMSMHEDLNAGDINMSNNPNLSNRDSQHFDESAQINSENYKQIESPESLESVRSDDNSHEDTTYDEIVSVIKEIEEEKLKENYAAKQHDIELKLDSNRSGMPIVGSASKDELKSPDKLESILNYLDDVESSCDKTLLETRRSIPETNRSEIEFVVEPDIAEDVPKLPDLLMLPNHQLARRIISLSLRANELANAVYLSKEHVQKIRQENQKGLRLEKQNSANRLREQKKYFEEIVGRHQGFIEQLLKDKGTLCEKVAALTRRLESQSQAWEHKLETELARVKEMTLAGEKIRRERWVRENTKKIKELTVKGIESEINKINSNHQMEITDLKRKHQQELLDALDEARQKHEQVETSVRQSCAEDRESIIEKERNSIRERFERQLEEQQTTFNEQKAKLLEEFAAERERLQLETKQKDQEYQLKKQEMLKEKENALQETTAELEEKINRQDEKYQNQINSIKKQFESDFTIWKREFENDSKLREVDNENTIRQHYRTERDRQIDIIVTRMDLESQKVQEESEAKLSRLKEKYENDIREAELLEQKLRDKFNEARGKLAESDAQVQNYEAELKQLHIELDHRKKMCDEFLQEKEHNKENARKDIQLEITHLKTERDNEIQKIYKRVQQAIEKKDTTLDILQKENGSLRERCIKLEAIIRQQRKDYCVK